MFLVSNFHPASCGWLTTFSRERVYCANCYQDHLDRVRGDPNYAFVMSEVNNIIAIMEFQPARFLNWPSVFYEKRIEFVKAYLPESAVNLSRGKALVVGTLPGLLLTRATGCESASAPEAPHIEDAAQAIIEAIMSHQIVMFGKAQGNKQEYQWLCDLSRSTRTAKLQTVSDFPIWIPPTDADRDTRQKKAC